MSRVLSCFSLRPRLTVFVIALVAGVALEPDLPLTDDARFYVPAARAYGSWLVDAVWGGMTFDGQPFERATIDAAFGHNHEHPPVAKYVMAAGWLVLYRASGLLSEVAACRMGVTLLWAMMLAVVFGLVRRVRGHLPAVAATLGLGLMPRLLFDAHAETLDLPIAAFLLLSGALVFETLERPRLRTGLLAVGAFALALGTKHNAPFFLAALVAYWLVLEPPRLTGLELRPRPLPLVLGGLVVVSPLVAWLGWPWLWFDTVARIAAWMQYHLHHYGILFYYRGELYGDEVAPWHAPWLLTLLTLPVPFLVLAAAGALATLRAWAARWSRLRLATFDVPVLDDDEGARLGLFALFQAAAQLGAVSLPGVPSYGGVKLFLPLLPFLAILAGLGAGRLFAELAASFADLRRRQLAVGLTLTVITLPALVGTLAYRGTWLSYFNELAGGVRGAAAAGHERQYYDLGYPALARALARLLPDGGRVAVLPNPKEYGPHLAEWQAQERLPRSIRLVPPEGAELLVLTHESRWRDYPLLLSRYRTFPVVDELTIAGVPLYTVFDLRPRR